MKLYTKQDDKYIEVLPADEYSKHKGIKAVTLRAYRLRGQGKHIWFKVGKHYFYLIKRNKKGEDDGER